MWAVGGEKLMMQLEKTQESIASEERIVVSVRLRPLNAKEIARNDVSEWECINDNTIIHRSGLPERSMYPTAYTFDRVFRSDCPTKQVYEEAAKEVALSVISGINSSIFAYGQTSSGKTYTMGGITECAVADIYDYIQKHEEREFILKFSAMEIYNEAVRDLLSSDGTPLRLLDDPERGTIVDRLTEETLRDRSHLLELLSVCETLRQIGETSLNETSSRSHQILRLTIESSAREYLGKDSSSTLAASVDFVDLAGSERASLALSAGTRLKEGCHINRSLLTLGTVIRKLSKGRNGHVPYRDSKLTRILQSSLGGNARTAIICTINPARSHVEQSRNTLSFASCAKEVATSAHVNVVMSDKALLKHLQRELARLESELRSPGPDSDTCDSIALLREKDLQIQKMEKEIKELTQQRDIAQSRLEDLVQLAGDDQAPGLWVEHDPKSHAPKEWEDEYLIPESESESSSLADNPRFNMSLYSDGSRESNSDDHLIHFLPHEESSEDHHQSLTQKICDRLPENPEDQFLSNNASVRLSVSSPKFVGPHPYQGWEEIKLGNGEDFEELCKEVRCIELEESKNVKSNALSPEERKRILPLTVSGNGDETDQDLASSQKKAGDEELSHVHTDFTYDALEKKLHDVQKTINSLINPSPDELSPWIPAADLSNSRSLTRSRSCRATLMTSSSSPRFTKVEQNEKTPLCGFERDFPGRPEGFERRISALNYKANSPNLSREDSLTSERSSPIDELKVHSIKTPSQEDIASIRSFVTGMKEMAKLQCEKQLVEDQGTESKADESRKSVKDVGLDPIQDPLESPSSWPLEFERRRREIIELWHICDVSLVHRTYFFLLFKGDPKDSIYMEVELRRLSFLKDTFEGGRDLTPASSKKALTREREMLSKQMQKRFSEEERKNLYRKWGIGLDTKKRRLQLAHRLWTNTEDIDNVMESASLVAKLVGLLEPGKAPKEMFGLSFTPQSTCRRSFSWRNNKSSLL